MIDNSFFLGLSIKYKNISHLNEAAMFAKRQPRERLNLNSNNKNHTLDTFLALVFREQNGENEFLILYYFLYSFFFTGKNKS